MSISRAAIWSIVDQALLSAAHFSLGLVVLRAAPKAGYGTYLLSWAVLVLFVGIQNSLVTSQMTLQASGLATLLRAKICAAFLSVQSLFLSAGLGLVLLIWSFLYLLGLTDLAWQFLSCGLACWGSGLREFVRSYTLIEGDTKRTFYIDVVYVTVLAPIAISIALFLPPNLVCTGILSAIGISGAVASIGQVRALLTVRGPLSPAIALVRRSAYEGGFWALGGVLVTHVQSQSYVYLVTSVFTLAATAEIGAARLFLMPISLSFTSLQRVLYPRWVALVRERRAAELKKSSQKWFAAMSIALLLYILVLEGFADTLVPMLFGPRYSASSSFLILFAALTWVEVARSIASLQLQAQGRFRDITFRNLLTATVAIATGFVGLPFFGPSFALLSQAFAEGLLAILLFAALRKYPRS